MQDKPSFSKLVHQGEELYIASMNGRHIRVRIDKDGLFWISKDGFSGGYIIFLHDEAIALRKLLIRALRSKTTFGGQK